MGTKNNPGNVDCYALALPDEHVFVLLGRDPATPATVRFWMGERARLGKNVDPDDLHKLGEAGMVADAAEKWRASLIELAGTDGILPWHINPSTERWGGPDRPVRQLPGDRPEMDTSQLGPVKMTPQFASWHESRNWAVGIGYKGSMSSVPALLDDLARDGWRFVQHSFSADAMLFEKVWHVMTAQDLGPVNGIADEETERLIAALSTGKVRRSLRKALARGYAQERHKDDDTPAPEGVYYAVRLYDEDALGAYAGVAMPDHSIMCEITPDSVVGGTQEACLAVAEGIAAALNGDQVVTLTGSDETLMRELFDEDEADCGCGTLDRCKDTARDLLGELLDAGCAIGDIERAADAQPGVPLAAQFGAAVDLAWLCRFITWAQGEVARRKGTDLGRQQEP